jgi:myosin heavy subunit
LNIYVISFPYFDDFFSLSLTLPVEAGKKLAATTSVSYMFRQQLEVLLHSLQGTQPHYVVCYKPNATGEPNALDRNLLLQQLHYSGALEVVRIRQKG